MYCERMVPRVVQTSVSCMMSLCDTHTHSHKQEKHKGLFIKAKMVDVFKNKILGYPAVSPPKLCLYYLY